MSTEEIVSAVLDTMSTEEIVSAVLEDIAFSYVQRVLVRDTATMEWRIQLNLWCRWTADIDADLRPPNPI